MTDASFCRPDAPGPTRELERQGRSRSRLAGVSLVVGVGLAALCVIGYLIGLALSDGTVPACDRWVGCTATAREQWAWDAKPWASAGLLLGVLVAWFALVWTPISESEGFRKVGSIVGLIVLVPITGLFAVVFLGTLAADCDRSGMLCFSGPEAAFVFGSPGFVTGALTVLLWVGLAAKNTRVARLCATLALSVCAGAVVLAAAFFLFSVDWAG